MQPRVDVITLGVPDLDEARRFYVGGLGWEPVLDIEGEVVFIQVGHGRLLALFGAEDLEKDMEGRGPSATDRRGAGVAIGHNVETREEVDAVMADAEAAGATVIKPAQDAFWGGRHGYFADPGGFAWEVAWNSNWGVEPDGRVRIGSGE